MKKERIVTVMQLVEFGLVGVSNTVISLGIYYLFLWINPTLYLIGNTLGWVVGVANAFFWNNRYVFKSENKDMRSVLLRIGKTYLSYGATFLLSTVLLYLEVDVLGWSSAISPLLNLILTIPLNFLLNKFWAFR